MADRIKLAEEWLLRPENNIGQELKHREYLKGEPLCGNGIISPECEVCRLSLMLSAYRLYSPLVGDGDPALVDDQLEAATRFLARSRSWTRLGSWTTSAPSWCCGTATTPRRC